MAQNFYCFDQNEDTVLNTGFLNNSSWLLSFSQRLISLIQDCGYTGEKEDVNACVRFLLDKYQTASIPISRTTIKSWFSGEQRPYFEDRSRNRMYELCFALHFDYAQVRYFFEKVYLSRCFNCRNLKEAVYCYCFCRGQNYQKFTELYEQAKQILQHAEGNYDNIPYTSTMENQIQALETDEDFLRYAKENKNSFSEYNQSARRELESLIGRIKGTENDRILVNTCRRIRSDIRSADYKKLEGFVVKEYFMYHDSCEDLKGLNVASSDFMLSQILGICFDQYYKMEREKQSFSKNANLTELARKNFPSKQFLSGILQGREKISFDAVRKMVILLHFYSFFVQFSFQKNYSDLSEAYIEDADDQLHTCGYGPLYPGNPYDWIFLYSSKSCRPLDRFRSIISGVIDVD